MTPLYSALARHLRRPAALSVMVLVYAVLLFATFMAIGARPPDIIYIDVPQADK